MHFASKNLTYRPLITAREPKSLISCDSAGLSI